MRRLGRGDGIPGQSNSVYSLVGWGRLGNRRVTAIVQAILVYILTGSGQEYTGVCSVRDAIAVIVFGRCRDVNGFVYVDWLAYEILAQNMQGMVAGRDGRREGYCRIN